jgi:hypothetical protein
MNTTDRFDDQIAEHLRADAPREAPNGLLDMAMSRIADTPQGGQGWFGRPATRLLAAAAVLVLAVVVGTQLPGLINSVGDEPSPSPSPSSSSAASPPAATSPSAEPSAEPSSTPVVSGDGETLLSFIALCDVLPPIIGPSVSILDDGRVIWHRLNADQVSTTLSVRRLNAEGLAQVIEAVTGTGLFGEDNAYDLVRRPGTPDPPGHGLCRWVFDWSGDDGAVQVESTMWLGDDEESAYYEPAPERLALHELALNVQDPEAWIDSTGWDDPEAVPFTPLSYLVLAGPTVPEVVTEGAPDVDAVSWPFEQGPDAFGEPVDEAGRRCGVAEAEAIDELMAQLAAAGLEQFVSVQNGAGAVLPWGSRDAALDLFIYAQRPNGEPPCAGSTIGAP